ncbi:MAG: hypothetical protein QM774_12530 [Gordonia sp. (in: high G+C Gram-positive bacteria)]|uniref:hypothetical protein n=1 Tax=Gordonia sp. (in: high G+C Gram-positive bacteria) TaxID=84139 RepID=UPI0039E54D6B
MRGLVTFLATLIAILGIVVAVPTVWGERHIVDTDGFAASASKAAHDREVQDFFAEQISTQIAQASGVSAAGTAAKPLAQSYTRSPAFAADFAEVARQQHDWLFTEPAPGQKTDTMDLNITPMVNRVLQGSPIPVKVNQAVTIEMDQSDLTAGQLKQPGDIVRIAAWVSVIAAIGGAVVALLFGRRRGAVLAWLGIGGIIGGAVGWFIAWYGERLVVSSESPEPLPAQRTIQLVTHDILSSLTSVSVITAVAGVAAVIIGVIAGVATRR